MEDLFVDDLITGCDKLTDVQTLKTQLYKYSENQGFSYTSGIQISMV